MSMWQIKDSHSVSDLEIKHDLEMYKLISEYHDLHIGLLFCERQLDVSRIYYDIIYWSGSVENNVVFDNFSPAPSEITEDQKLDSAFDITTLMAVEAINGSSDRVFVECYEAFKQIGLTDNQINDLDCVRVEFESNDDDDN